VIVNLYPKPVMTVTDNTDICRGTSIGLSATGGVSYAWSPSGTLDNPGSPTPTASPTGDTRYYVTITDANSCNYLDSVDVTIRHQAVFAVNGGGQICSKDSFSLNASGGNIYTWTPSTGLSDPGIPNPHASPGTTTDYSVTIVETTCNESTVLTTRVGVLGLPAVHASRETDIDCTIDRTPLLATGAIKYAWAPAATLSNQGAPNPVATPRTTTKYYVTGTDAAGCHNIDSVVVKVEAINEGGYLMPNAFTPNGDGINDCFGIRYWGIIDEVKFSIFNRWGQRIFYTTNPNGCWDGKVNGVEQGSDVFVYIIEAKTTCSPSVFRKGTFLLIR
jgi:gliding motility-associated-like protein